MADELKDAKDSLTLRLSERFGDPLLFTFVLLVLLREWPFFYAVVRGGPNVDEAIRTASRYYSFDHIKTDAFFAVLFVLIWPWVGRLAAWYRDWVRIGTENMLQRLRDRKALIPVRELHRHRDYITAVSLAKDLHEALHRQVLTGYLDDLDSDRSKFLLAVERARPLEEATFAVVRAVEENSVPVVTALDYEPGDGKEVVFVVRRLPGTQGRTMLLCARSGAEIRWPKGLPFRPHLAQVDGRLFESVGGKQEKPRFACIEPISEISRGKGKGLVTAPLHVEFLAGESAMSLLQRQVLTVGGGSHPEEPKTLPTNAAVQKDEESADATQASLPSLLHQEAHDVAAGDD
jgi:hypothetical protein